MLFDLIDQNLVKLFVKITFKNYKKFKPYYLTMGQNIQIITFSLIYLILLIFHLIFKVQILILRNYSKIRCASQNSSPAINNLKLWQNRDKLTLKFLKKTLKSYFFRLFITLRRFYFQQKTSFFRRNSVRCQIQQAFQWIQRNARQISSLTENIQLFDKRVSQLFQKIDQIQQTFQLEKLEQKKTSSMIQDDNMYESCFETFETEIFLTKFLFGKKQYKYKIIMVDEFPKIIYRQRNINIRIKLVSTYGQPIKNDNVINLYLTLCDNQGKWITNNRVADPMLKGKTSTQLCSGESQFNKICPQDISRTFLDGKINIVIYPQSTALLYDQKGSEPSEKIFINLDQIQSLVIQEIVIKAKKKAF